MRCGGRVAALAGWLCCAGVACGRAAEAPGDSAAEAVELGAEAVAPGAPESVALSYAEAGAAGDAAAVVAMMTEACVRRELRGLTGFARGVASRDAANYGVAFASPPVPQSDWVEWVGRVHAASSDAGDPGDAAQRGLLAEGLQLQWGTYANGFSTRGLVVDALVADDRAWAAVGAVDEERGRRTLLLFDRVGPGWRVVAILRWGFDADAFPPNPPPGGVVVALVARTEAVLEALEGGDFAGYGEALSEPWAAAKTARGVFDLARRSLDSVERAERGDASIDWGVLRAWMAERGLGEFVEPIESADWAAETSGGEDLFDVEMRMAITLREAGGARAAYAGLLALLHEASNGTGGTAGGSRIVAYPPVYERLFDMHRVYAVVGGPDGSVVVAFQWYWVDEADAWRMSPMASGWLPKAWGGLR